ncbi:MAG: transposase [bacterium]
MINNQELHLNKSVRLHEYDYSHSGYYYITVCTHNREQLFGHINDGKMILNDYGKALKIELFKTEELRPTIDIDYYCIMPNHIHLILIIKHSECSDTACRVSAESFGKPITGSIPTIIRSLKSAATKRINELRHTPGYSIWQPNFYEHIIRNEKELYELRKYIENNPLKFELDY